jgi:putative FmdB family regulatory protein
MGLLPRKSICFLLRDESGIIVIYDLRKEMPLYEYKCTKCGFVFEVLQKVNDTPLKRCARCQGPVKKLISPSALQFKGSGWYVTDYASKGKQAPQTKTREAAKKDKGVSTENKSPASSSSDKK